MEKMQDNKNLILIADDSEMNRSILADMLSDEYEIIEAENGVQAISLIKLHGEDISIILLDIVMPEADGFDVLEDMNKNGWIEKIPVIMISAENRASTIERAYEMGVTDFISRPFDALIVHRRVVNTILLYTKQKKLIEIATKQVYEKERQSLLMIEILSHIVEFRNGESGSHVRRVRLFTEMLMNELIKRSDKYKFTRTEISTISTASALHDIGKIAIPEAILNKPGKLTKNEFEIIKTHSMVGAKMLSELHIPKEDKLVKAAYEICRWHHERYDGSGYPDGLKGDDIPISAQIVSMADVFDALISDRVYKKAVPKKEAIEMIVDGQCGAFNPILIECLIAIQDELEFKIENLSEEYSKVGEAQRAIEEMLRHDDVTASRRTLQLLENERMKFDYFASLTNEIQFEYSAATKEMKLSYYGARRLGLPEIVVDPKKNSAMLEIVTGEDIKGFSAAVRSTSSENPEITYDLEANIEGTKRWFRIVSRTLWTTEEVPVFSGFIGKALDIHDSRMKLRSLEKKASTDALTGIMNHAGAKEIIKARLAEDDGKKYALAIFDLDRFKQANDTYGHMFGDEVLIYTAKKLRQSIRGSDIMARVGGDEFLIFLEYNNTEAEQIISRIFNSLCGTYKDFKISLSMGVATNDAIGNDYDALFSSADKALYTIKRNGSGKYRFYDDSIHGIFSVISPIDD